jgi:hypothetical protein
MYYWDKLPLIQINIPPVCSVSPVGSLKKKKENSSHNTHCFSPEEPLPETENLTLYAVIYKNQCLNCSPIRDKSKVEQMGHMFQSIINQVTAPNLNADPKHIYPFQTADKIKHSFYLVLLHTKKTNICSYPSTYQVIRK